MTLGATALALMGCSGGEEESSPPIVPPAVFGDPAAFGREGCAPGSLAGLAPGGIWHVDNTTITRGSFPSVIRFDEEPAGLAALLNGRPADDLRFTGDDLFTRTEYEAADGYAVVRAYDACRLDPDGSLGGSFGRCEKGECYSGTFRAVRVERIPGEVESQGIEKVSEWAGDPAAPWEAGLSVNVRVKDGLAYLARYHDGLRIIDVSDPAAPGDVGGSPVMFPTDKEFYNDVKLIDAADGKRYALMASNRRGIVCLDVSDPASPKEVATFPAVPDGEDPINVHTLFIETLGASTRAYIADLTSGGLGVYDVTAPASPVLLGTFVHPDVPAKAGQRTAPQSAKHLSSGAAFLHDLYVEDGRAYLSYWGLGLVIVDATSAPAPIVQVGQFKDYKRRTNHSNWVTTVGQQKIVVVGDEDFGAHMRILDADPTSNGYMTMIGELQLRPEVSIHNIMAFEDKAFVAHYQDGLRIIDLSDPTTPAVTGYFNTWDGRNGSSFYEGATGIDVDREAGLVYVADTERGLLIFREAM